MEGCFPLWGLFSHSKLWLNSCCLRQAHDTATRTHTCKASKEIQMYFFTFTVATLTNPAATSVRFVHTGKCGPLHASFQNSLRETHLCPRADILITIPPMRSAGERVCAQNKEAPTVGCCRTARVDKRDLRVAPGCVWQTTPAATRKWNYYLSWSFFLTSTSMRKKEGGVKIFN